MYGFEIELRPVFIKISYRCRRKAGRGRLFRAYKTAPSSALEIIRPEAQFEARRRRSPAPLYEEWNLHPDGPVAMSATTQATKNSTLAPSFTLRAILQWVCSSIEEHAQYRVRSAMSPSQCQQVDQEIRRYRRRLMNVGR